MTMQTVDRAGFMYWNEGVFLHFKNGTGIAPSEPECTAAEEALERGEKVALTVRGKIVSYLEPREDGVYEIRA